MAEHVDGGREAVSTEDVLAHVVNTNETQTGWTKESWWENKIEDNFIACATCPGKEDYIYSRTEPELCSCSRNTVSLNQDKQERIASQSQSESAKEDNKNVKTTTSSTEGAKQTSENNPSVPCEHNKHGFCRTHRTLSKQIEVTKSTWKDRGGGKGFGFVKSKVKKFICPDKNKSPVTPLNIPMFDNYSASNISRHVGQGRENNENIHTSRKFHSGISDNIAAGLERRNQVKE